MCICIYVSVYIHVLNNNTSIPMYFLNAKPALAAISHPHSVLLPVSVALYAVTEAFLLKRMGQRSPKT